NDALNNSGAVTNNAGATYNADVINNASGTITNAGTWNTLAAGFLNAGTFSNTGVLNATAGGFTNSGIANVQNTISGTITNSGTLTLTGNLTANSTLTNQAAGLLDIRSFTLTGATSVSSDGTITGNNGTILAPVSLGATGKVNLVNAAAPATNQLTFSS